MCHLLIVLHLLIVIGFSFIITVTAASGSRSTVDAHIKGS
jgi:hypothetical protein